MRYEMHCIALHCIALHCISWLDRLMWHERGMDRLLEAWPVVETCRDVLRSQGDSFVWG